jgi:ComF family protein
MSILDTFIGKLAPHECLGCGAEGDLLCSACSANLTAAPERCYLCQKIMNKSLTCSLCRSKSSLHRVHVVTVYGTVAKSLIWKLKLAGAQSAARIMALHMARLMGGLPDKAIIVPVPTATSRVRQRGYDQAKLLARELSKQTRLPYRNCLARSGQTHQHGLPRRERLTRLETAFHASKAQTIHKAHVILVDDVVTTGATFEAAAKVLRAAGAAQIEAVVFAQPLNP